MASHRLSKLDIKARKRRIADALVGVKGKDFGVEVDRLLAALGYESQRRLLGQSGEPAEFLEQLLSGPPSWTKSEQAFLAAVRCIRLLFQFTEEELQSAGGGASAALTGARRAVSFSLLWN